MRVVAFEAVKIFVAIFEAINRINVTDKPMNNKEDENTAQLQKTNDF